MGASFLTAADRIGCRLRDEEHWAQMGSRPLAKGISQNFGQRNQKAAAAQKCNGDHIQDLLSAAVSQRQCSFVRRTNHCQDALFERSRVGQACRLMKLWGYGAVAVVMADAWGEEATKHVRRGHIFAASCPSLAANICFGYARCAKQILSKIFL